MMAPAATALADTMVVMPHALLRRTESAHSDSQDSSQASTQDCLALCPPTPNVQALVRACNCLGCAYLVCSIVTFCSSAYTGPGSALDVVLFVSDVVCVDVSSALFVMAGCTVASVLRTSAPDKQTRIARQAALVMLLDLYGATLCALVLGSLHALMLARFRWADVAFTAVDGLTTLRTLDFRQSAAAPHPYNVTAWPLQSLLWCVLSTPGLLRMEGWLAERAPQLADTVVCLCSVLGITLFTAFGSMQTSSNIFYANASSVTYRSLEFNLGVHAVFLLGRHAALVAALRHVCRHAAPYVAVLVGTVWFSEIGRPLSARTDDNCLRLYHRSSCLQDHHGFFLRGCVLALFALLCINTGPPEQLARELRVASALLPAMAFCWPLCIAVKLVLDVTFGAALVGQNRPVVLVMCAAALGVLSMWYVSIVQPKLSAGASRALRRGATGPAPPPDSPRTPLV